MKAKHQITLSTQHTKPLLRSSPKIVAAPTTSRRYSALTSLFFGDGIEILLKFLIGFVFLIGGILALYGIIFLIDITLFDILEGGDIPAIQKIIGVFV